MFSTFQDRISQKKSFKLRAYVAFGGVPIRLSWPTASPSQRKALLERYPLSQLKQGVICSLARNRTKQILRCNNQANELGFNCPVIETSESIEPNVNDLINSIACTFFKIFEPGLKEFLRRSRRLGFDRWLDFLSTWPSQHSSVETR